MKKITVTNAHDLRKLYGFETDTISVELSGPEIMEASDGYHNFAELYEHRHTVFIQLCKVLNKEDEMQKSLRAFKDGFAFDPNGWVRNVWRSKLHSDGSSYDGWFILGINKAIGEQITYHLPLSKWEATDFAETLEKAPEYDGHTPEDVLKRLVNL